MINGGFTAKWVSEITEQFIAELTMKRIETGHAENQPKWPHWVKPVNYSRKEWDEMGTWMITTLGNGDWMMDGLWVGSDRKYWFRDERDRTLFILKWS